MSSLIAQYPLKQVLEIKMRRVDEAERVVKEKKRLLEKEEEKLKERKAERDKVLKHRNEKLSQLRQEMDHDTTTVKIQQMKAYLKIVAEKLVVEEKKVEEQKRNVSIAQEALDKAKEELRLKRLEVDKLNTHRSEWVEEMKKELEIEEGRLMDEVGEVIYQIRKMGGK